MDGITPFRVSGQDLREELHRAFAAHFGKPRQISSLRRRRSNYSSSYTIENLEVELDHGERLSLVFKDLSPVSLLKEAQQVRPQFLYSPQREIEIYRTVLNPQEFQTPVYYGAVQCPDRDRYWLFLERVKGPLLWQVGRLEQWEQSARWLARLHYRFAGHDHQSPLLPAAILRYNARHCRRWIERASDFLAQRLEAVPTEWVAQFKQVARGFDRVVDQMLALPQTLIHGEFYPSNVILRNSGTDRRICPIDWEMASFGPGLVDLAALTSGAWSEDQKRRLVAAYRDALYPTEDWPPSLDALLRLVDLCQLYLAIQWLGWSGEWSPPQSHDQNWLTVAAELSNRLGL